MRGWVRTITLYLTIDDHGMTDEEIADWVYRQIRAAGGDAVKGITLPSEEGELV